MRQKLHQYKLHRRYAVGSLVLITVLALGLVVTFVRINTMVVDNCYSSLDAATEMAAAQVNDAFSRDQQHLKSLASVIAAQEDLHSDTVVGLLQSFSSADLISRLAILYPDDQVMLNTGECLDGSSVLCFAQLSKLGNYISGISCSVDDPNQQILRSSVPIVQNHKVVAILYGIIFLNHLPDVFQVSAYDGQAQLYIVDRYTGEILLGSRDDKIDSLSSLNDLTFSKSFSAEQTISDIQDGVSGNTAFIADSSGKPLYFHYQRLNINHWQVMLSVPESAVFEEARISRTQLVFLAVLYGCAFLLYTLWSRSLGKKVSLEQERHLRTIEFMNSVEKTLFDFHLNPDRMREALECVQSATNAGCAFLMVWKDQQISVLFQSGAQDFPTQEIMGKSVEDQFPAWYPIWQQAREVEADLSSVGQPERRFMELLTAYNLYALPIFEAVGSLRAALIVTNWDSSPANTELLKKSALSFAMALSNQESYFRIEQMGMLDYNTGLLNRNCYMDLLRSYQSTDSGPLSCIYTDADGLHDLNNRCGHDAGDRMLRAIADALKVVFPDADHFRIGGDEFVSIITGQEPGAVRSGVDAMQALLNKDGYHVSSGIASGTQQDSLEDLVHCADAQMLDEKRVYYETIGNRRELP